MQHRIPIESLGAQGEAMAAAVEACVHCGFCLPACPTYLTLGEEMDSPRGRIVLMKGVLEGELALEEVLPHVDRCLGCVACETACPSGVRYGELLTPFREMAEERRERTWGDRLARLMVEATLPYPGRFRLAIALSRLARPLRRLLPDRMRVMLDLTPTRLPAAAPLPALVRAEGERRARVALLVGCAQQVLSPGINQATIRVLARNGVDVIIPPDQGCCGALSMHAGAAGRARNLARRNLAAFDPSSVDAVVTSSAGCGSGMHEYPLLFAGREEAVRAAEFAGKVRDVSDFLAELGIQPPPALPEPLTVAYHDACHLAHAQGIRESPRELIRSIPGVTIIPLPEAEICCGSAGSYNIEQPEIAERLGARKADAVASAGARLLVTGNIGCATQIGMHLRRLGRPMPVRHTIELLDWAYRGGDPGWLDGG